MSQLAGCLPALFQAPFFMVIYRVFTNPGLLSANLFGLPLGARLFGGGYPMAFLPVIAALVALGWISARRTRRVAAANGSPAPAGLVAVLPFLSVLSVVVVPLGTALYLVTTLAWTAVENVVLRRGLAPRPGAAGNAPRPGPA